MALSLFGNGWSNGVWGPSWLDSAWDPFELMDHSPFKSYAQGARALAGTNMDWLETPKAHVFKADLPGLKKEDVKVQLEDDHILEISGERSKEEVRNTDTWHTVERSHGKFLCRFKLPNDANAEAVSAKVIDNVLTMTLAKAKVKKPEFKSINVA